MMQRFRFTILFSAFVCLASLCLASDREHEVKSAFILNFARYCEWASLGPEGSPFVIGIFRTNAYDDSIVPTLQGKSVSGHPVSIQKATNDEDFGQCRIIVVGDLHADQIKHLIKVCRNAGTLLIGESPSFAKDGGAIGFLIHDRTVRFEINLKTASTDGVQISSKLLNVAAEVYR